MIETIRQIIAIRKEDELMQEFNQFEEVLESKLAPLRALLQKEMLSQDVAEIESHVSQVEAHRDRVGRFSALAAAFLEHAKSDHFSLPKTDGVSESDRTAYQKHLTAGFVGVERDLRGLIKSIDSRVNLCKKQLSIEAEAGMGSHRR